MVLDSARKKSYGVYSKIQEHVILEINTLPWEVSCDGTAQKLETVAASLLAES